LPWAALGVWFRALFGRLILAAIVLLKVRNSTTGWEGLIVGAVAGAIAGGTLGARKHAGQIRHHRP